VILDTDALSAFAGGDSALVAELGRAPALALPVIVLGEYRFGFVQSRWRAQYEEWLVQVVQRGVRILEITAETAACYAEIRSELKRAGQPIPSNDVWIAALCRQHALPLLSRDAHFDAVTGLRRVAW
jgi:predicted nucleic acid-binding protein